MAHDFLCILNHPNATLYDHEFATWFSSKLKQVLDSSIHTPFPSNENRDLIPKKVGTIFREKQHASGATFWSASDHKGV